MTEDIAALEILPANETPGLTHLENLTLDGYLSFLGGDPWISAASKGMGPSKTEAENNAALADAVALLPNGGKLLLPPGKIPLSATITNVDNLTIESAGAGTTLHNTTAGVDALKLVNCDDLDIRGVRVQGTSGTRDGLHLENCQRATVKVYCGGTGRAAIYAQRCFGIMLDNCGVSVNSGPYPTGIANMQAGLVLTWDGSDVTSGCNQFVINGGTYVIGQTPQSSTSTPQFTPGWAIQLIRCEGGEVNGPIAELSAGGIYGQYCENVNFNSYYGELNPSDIEYSTGTMSITAGLTAVTGVGTDWDNVPTPPEVDNGFPGKYLVAPLTSAMAYAKIAALVSDTSLTLAATTELMQAGWPAATQSGVAYRLTAFDLFLDGCKGGSIGAGCRGGGAIALKGSYFVEINNPLCESLLIDGGSYFTTISMVRTNRASAGATSRILDFGSRTIIGRQVNYPNVGDVLAPGLPIYTLATRPSATLRAAQLIYVSDAAANNKLQYSDGAAWVAAG